MTVIDTSHVAHEVECRVCGQRKHARCFDNRFRRTKHRATPHPERTLDALVEAVKAHALAHYEEGGWDVVVECWDDAQIAEHVKGTRTVTGAVGRFEGVVSVWADRQADARNSAF